MMTPVSPATLKAWLDAREAVLVDVREPAEFESEHIPGAALNPAERRSERSEKRKSRPHCSSQTQPRCSRHLSWMLATLPNCRSAA